jgi:hypothetical protein
MNLQTNLLSLFKDNDMLSHPLRSLLVYSLIGILCTVPCFAAFAIIGVLGDFLCKWQAGTSLGVGLLSRIVLPWGSSLLSGLICGWFLKYHSGIGLIFLANSSGWASLFFLSPTFASGLLPSDIDIEFYFIALFVSIVGLLITWGTMKSSAASAEKGCTDRE